MNKLSIILIIFFSNFIIAQSDCDRYKDNYIPNNLTDVFAYFECNWSKESLETFKKKDEKSAIVSLHRGYGMTIRNNWKLWERKGELVKLLNKKGIYHPEDMSAVIFASFHRKLNKKPIELEKQAEFYQTYWTEIEQQEKERRQKEFSEFKVGDKVEFSYDYDFVSEKQEKKWMNDKCYASGVIIGLNAEKLKLQVKLKKSCDRKGIIILKYDVWNKIEEEYQKIEEDKIEIMKKGEIRWTSYELWGK